MTIQKTDGLGAYAAIQGEPYLPSYTVEAGPGASGLARPVTNYLLVNQQHASITGSYLVDTTRQIPATLLGIAEEPHWLAVLTGSDSSKKVKANATFKSQYGCVDLKLAVKGGSTATIIVEGMGNTDVAIDGRERGTTLNLSVSSSARARISLPSDFNGVVKGGASHGRVLFSEELKARTTTFAEDSSNPQGGRYFIGDWTIMSQASNTATTSSTSRDEEWKGDCLNINSNYGDVQIETWDEKEAQILAAERRKAERGGWEGWVRGVQEESCKVFGALASLILACINPTRHSTDFVAAESA